MNTKKQSLLLPLVLLLVMKSLGQSTFPKLFTYDQNGNRTGHMLAFAKADRIDNSKEGAHFMDFATDTLRDLTIQIYPNPTNDRVFVSTAMDETTPSLRAVLMTSTGSVLEEKRLDGGTESLDLSGKAPGLYILEIGTKETRHLWKIIKR